jgi:type IV secretory pathway VirB9-like protein
MVKLREFVFALVLFGLVEVPAHAQVTKDSLDQHADQAQGNYAATNLNYLGSGSLGMMQSAWKDPLQHMGEGQSRPGYSKYYWSPELVLPVRVREAMWTLINFPSWEIVERVFVGDSSAFKVEIVGPSSLMVAPMDQTTYLGVDTNMTVFGRSGNKYVFYVQSETVNSDRITNSIIDIEVVKKKGGSISSGGGFSGDSGRINASNYRGDDSSSDSTFTNDMQKEDWIEKIPVDPTKFRFDIEVYVPNPDDIIIAPERVWRDNIFTYIDLGEKALTAIQRPMVVLPRLIQATWSSVCSVTTRHSLMPVQASMAAI